MTKRILSCFFAILLCLLCFSACSSEEDGVPEGMYSVTKDGEPFILYVPGDWTDNRDSGISAAYIMNDGIFVSARHYSLNGLTLEAYVDGVLADYERIYESSNFDSIERSSKESLSKKTATKLQFSFDRGDEKSAVNTTVTQYYAEHKGEVIVLSFYCTTERYKAYKDIFATIKTEFVIRNASNSGSAPVTDEDTPEGMKNASFSGGEYAFYVPKSWDTDMSDKLTEATAKDKKANVTVTGYLPSVEMTVDEYFELCESEYKKLGDSYTLLKSGGRYIKTVGSDGENNATTFEYKIVRGETSYVFSQTVLYYNGMFYSITYTALEENFDTYQADLEKMLENCRFK